MKKIGLTGGIGSGKSTVANFFAELGIEVIDADKIVHELLADNAAVLQKIIEHFGSMVVTEKHELDRKLLREIIFNDIKERKWLENLLHPLVYKIMIERANMTKSPYCVLVIPLLFETNSSSMVDRVLVVESSQENQIIRSLKRDQTNLADIKNIMAAQIDRETRLKKADDIIYNDGTLETLKSQIIKLHDKYLHM